ncbi:uncharacterized protein LOC109828511 [Asparagus officinalis]|uniref:uncharacterized protein LOC109828511 n=1 Tax=Asparagus officinalis TaxID=4686 RepID=UPI00098E1C1A|nr:uncharacterized protein LOC109828511 [Asparagus officinalis]
MNKDPGRIQAVSKDLGNQSSRQDAGIWKFKSVGSTSWKDICSMGREVNQNCSLQYFPPSVDSNGIQYASIPRSEILLNVDKWNNTLIGYVLGDKPFYSHLKGCVARLWKLSCSLDIYSRENGFFFFKFGSNEELNRVLNGGPWLFDGRLIILKKWSENIDLERELLTSVPVWIRLPSLHLKLWSNNIIGRIASLVGNPLYIDQATATGERLAFARCFVEISSKAKLPTTVKLDLGNGEWLETSVEYEWIPPRCSKCHNFGHVEYQCPVVLVDKWIPKSTNNGADNIDSGSTAALVNLYDKEHEESDINDSQSSKSVFIGDIINDNHVHEVVSINADAGKLINEDATITEVNYEDTTINDVITESEFLMQHDLRNQGIAVHDINGSQIAKELAMQGNYKDISDSKIEKSQTKKDDVANTGISEKLNAGVTPVFSVTVSTSSHSDQAEKNIAFINTKQTDGGKFNESVIDFPIAIDNPEWLNEKSQLLMKKKSQFKINKDTSSGPKRVTRASSANIS